MWDALTCVPQQAVGGPRKKRFPCAPFGAHFERCVPFEISYVSLRTAAEATRNDFVKSFWLFCFLTDRERIAERVPEAKRRVARPIRCLTPALSAKDCFLPTTLTRSATTLSRSRERGTAFEAEKEKHSRGLRGSQFSLR